jgi:hypothetical protein
VRENVIVLSKYGTDLSSRTTGTAARLVIDGIAKGHHRVVVDCNGIRTLSESFADEVFGILVAEHGKPWFKERISVIGLTESTRNAILSAVAERLDATSGG